MTQIVVLGGGNMGISLAALFLANGNDVIIVTRRKEAVESIRDRVNAFVSKAAGKNAGKFVVSTDVSTVSSAEIVIEALEENIEVKKKALAEVETVCPNAFFYSNTSSLSITELSTAFRNPGLFGGLHFFNPAHKMQLVEVVKGSKTSQECVEKGVEIARRLGKTPVVVVDSPGFIVNRLLVPFLLDAVKLKEAGVASERDIDTAVKLGLNHPLGPFELIDLIGLDVFLSIVKQLELEAPRSIVQMVKAGKLGRKTKQGFYEYT